MKKKYFGALCVMSFLALVSCTEEDVITSMKVEKSQITMDSTQNVESTIVDDLNGLIR